MNFASAKFAREAVDFPVKISHLHADLILEMCVYRLSYGTIIHRAEVIVKRFFEYFFLNRKNLLAAPLFRDFWASVFFRVGNYF